MSYVVWVLCWVLLLSFKTSHSISSHSSLVLVVIVSLILVSFLVVIVSLILVNIASLCSSQRCVRYSCLQDAKNLSKTSTRLCIKSKERISYIDGEDPRNYH